MTTYAAFLRGIGPGNPNMRNEKLKSVLESLGYTNVQAVISSGNLIFSSGSKNIRDLEIKIQKAMEKQLGFDRGAFIRSQKELTDLLAKDPFKGKEHGRKTYLVVTFLKKKPGEIFTVIDTTTQHTPDFMRDLDKKYGKENTTRTLKTLERMVKKMAE